MAERDLNEMRLLIKNGLPSSYAAWLSRNNSTKFEDIQDGILEALEADEDIVAMSPGLPLIVPLVTDALAKAKKADRLVRKSQAKYEAGKLSATELALVMGEYYQASILTHTLSNMYSREVIRCQRELTKQVKKSTRKRSRKRPSKRFNPSPHSRPR